MKYVHVVNKRKKSTDTDFKKSDRNATAKKCLFLSLDEMACNRTIICIDSLSTDRVTGTVNEDFIVCPIDIYIPIWSKSP